MKCVYCGKNHNNKLNDDFCKVCSDRIEKLTAKIKKEMERHKTKESLPYLEGDYGRQAHLIAGKLAVASSQYSGRKYAQARKTINEAYIHLSRLVHTM